MLPGFLEVAVVSSVIAVGNGIAIQQASRREPRATDFRVVQGALNGEAVCNLLSGLGGTIANTLYPSSVGGVSITGIAAKTADVCAGLIRVIVALSPVGIYSAIAIACRQIEQLDKYRTYLTADLVTGNLDVRAAGWRRNRMLLSAELQFRYTVNHISCEGNPMKNITVSVDEETHRMARIRAAELDTSVSALVREFLRSIAANRPVASISTVPKQEETPVALRPRDLDEVLADFDARGVGVSERLTRDELYAEVIERVNATH